MGGSIRKELTSNVTHLICQSAGGEKYQYAMTFRLTVVRSDFVFKAWENRDAPNFCALQEDFTNDHRLKAFEGHRICFFGFNPEDKMHMTGLLRTYGGTETELNDPECSHVVSTEILVLKEKILYLVQKPNLNRFQCFLTNHILGFVFLTNSISKLENSHQNHLIQFYRSCLITV